MRLARFLPRQIAAQLAALMLFAVIVFNVMMTTAFMLLPHPFEPPPRAHEERLNPVAGSMPPPGATLDAGHPTDWPPRPPGPPIIGMGPIVGTILFLSITVTTLGWWAARALIAPLKTFAEAAEHFRAGGGTVRLDEAGPTEIRTLARALNEMQARITDLVSERTRMLAAIGHDLRTPITRLRLRAEFMADLAEQNRMLADLDHMEALVKGALMHLREGRSGEGPVAADLLSLLETIVDQFGDLGSEVVLVAPRQLVARINPHEFQRAVTNLVENAVRYGAAPRIRVVRDDDGDVAIRIEDSGPGLDDSLKARMLEPFSRGDVARTMNGFEGFGLGLAIARQIAETHGGRLDLQDLEPTGLAAVIVLPASAVASWSE